MENNNRKINFYTLGRQLAARVLLIVWLCISCCNLRSALANPGVQETTKNVRREAGCQTEESSAAAEPEKSDLEEDDDEDDAEEEGEEALESKQTSSPSDPSMLSRVVERQLKAAVGQSTTIEQKKVELEQQIAQAKERKQALEDLQQQIQKNPDTSSGPSLEVLQTALKILSS